MCSCHSAQECYNLLSEVKLNIRSFCFISRETDGSSVFDSYLSSPKYMILLFCEHYFSPIWERDAWIAYLGAVWLPVFQSILDAGDHRPMALR